MKRVALAVGAAYTTADAPPDHVRPAVPKTTRDLIPGLGPLVRAARQSAGVSVDDLAASAGVSRSAIYDLEAEQRSPSARLLAAVCESLSLRLRTDRLVADVAEAAEKISKKIVRSS